ncbi:MAG: nucleoside hydrolase [Thermotogae bacterium]|nr:nucleoside hydrolase [Thermotogota bacterium]MCP5465498.1 nucleoside hydrolase [Thermotogota bacterium]
MKKIILDCDPGHDDAVALLFAGISESIDLLGVVAVAGNSYVENTVKNALKITEMASINVPVLKGAGKPILREQIVAPNIHGESGLEGVELPEPSKKYEEENYIHFYKRIIEENERNITIVAVGPLTNIGNLFLIHPELKDKISEIVIMGGGIAFGNTTPVAEFNIYADPEAAKIVFDSGVPLTVFGLDVTHQAKINNEEIRKMQEIKSEVVSKMGVLLEFFHKTYFDVFKIVGAPLHDPCAVIYLSDPEIFEYENYYTQIELNGKYTYGQTVVDYWHLSGKVNSKWAVRVNREKFIEILFENLKKYEKR